MQVIHFSNSHRKENVGIIMCFSKFFLYLLHLSACLIGWPVVQHFMFYLAHLGIPFNSLIQMVSCTEKFFAGLFLFLFSIGEFTIFSAFRLGSFGIDLYLVIWWLWCLRYKQFWICDRSFIVFVSSFHSQHCTSEWKRI